MGVESSKFGDKASVFIWGFFGLLAVSSDILKGDIQFYNSPGRILLSLGIASFVIAIGITKLYQKLLNSEISSKLLNPLVGWVILSSVFFIYLSFSNFQSLLLHFNKT